jgi:hypothetical protein
MAEGKKVNSADLNKVFTREDRIDRILNDVITWRKR